MKRIHITLVVLGIGLCVSELFANAPTIQLGLLIIALSVILIYGMRTSKNAEASSVSEKGPEKPRRNNQKPSVYDDPILEMVADKEQLTRLKAQETPDNMTVIDARNPQSMGNRAIVENLMKIPADKLPFLKDLVSMVELRELDEYGEEDLPDFEKGDVQKIGEAIHDIGGMGLMQIIYCRLKPLMGNHIRLLDMYWDGVGDWRG